MKSRAWKSATAGVFVLFSMLGASAAESTEQQKLNRSIYVPVVFEACEHMKYAVLYIGDTPVAKLPTERVFQFTYYPSLGRFEPAVTYLRLEGVDEQGTEVVGQLSVSPGGIATVGHATDLEMEKQLKQLAYKIDARFKKRRVLFRCHLFCGKEGPPPEVPVEDARKESGPAGSPPPGDGPKKSQNKSTKGSQHP